MKKLLYGLLSICIISIVSVYIFIPNQIIVSKAEQVESSERIISQHVNNRTERAKWWPEQSKSVDTFMQLNGFKYEFKAGNFNLNEVLIYQDDFQTKSTITWQVVSKNTIQISWATNFPASRNPIKRFIQYQKARQIKNNMDIILESLLSYVVKSNNIYGFDIKRSTVKDTILATATMTSSSKPETQEVYSLINSIKNFTEKNGVKQVSPPMLNVFSNEQGKFQTIVAIPINKAVKSESDVEIKRMVAGNILEMTVKGGPKTIETGFNQIKLYLNDFQLVSPAMPFESLVTDRIKEPDTSKWVTKIYYPIF